jgi:hypothetical protein
MYVKAPTTFSHLYLRRFALPYQAGLPQSKIEVIPKQVSLNFASAKVLAES